MQGLEGFREPHIPLKQALSSMSLWQSHGKAQEDATASPMHSEFRLGASFQEVKVGDHTRV